MYNNFKKKNTTKTTNIIDRKKQIYYILSAKSEIQ